MNNRALKTQRKENEGRILNLKWLALAFEDGTKLGGEITFSGLQKMLRTMYLILKEDKCEAGHD